ncbi:DUF3558 domain-containing protein [Streptomyces sp. NPDC086787]|uniref:DUF3558 domain-containing protein n=1 Tax=Streptomyces sp. NPDC086787 TaxID=3365759 RepID=UPI00381F581E
MQRAAQRDDRDDQRAQRDRRAGRLRRALVCAAAVPVVFAAAACSSDSGSDAKDSTGAGQTVDNSSGDSSVNASPSVAAAAFKKLPEPCAALTAKTLDELAPGAAKKGKASRSDDTASRAGCSWSSLDNNGVKGSQFRWLNVSLNRFDSSAGRGSGEEQAKAYYAKQVSSAKAVPGAKNTKSESVAGAGDEATAVRYDLKKKEGAFKQQTVVVRVENAVVTLDYNGAGLAGEKAPDAVALTKSAEKAAKEAAASVAAANGRGTAPGSGSDSGKASPTPSKSASKSAKPSPSTSAKASPSKSASKKS